MKTYLRKYRGVCESNFKSLYETECTSKIEIRMIQNGPKPTPQNDKNAILNNSNRR